MDELPGLGTFSPLPITSSPVPLSLDEIEGLNIFYLIKRVPKDKALEEIKLLYSHLDQYDLLKNSDESRTIFTQRLSEWRKSRIHFLLYLHPPLLKEM